MTQVPPATRSSRGCSQQFDTVIGNVAFDQKSDVTGAGFDWSVRAKDGPVHKG